MKGTLATLPPRKIRFLYSFAALLVFLLTFVNFLNNMVYNVAASDQCAWRPRAAGEEGILITDIIPGGVADKAGLRNNDILLKIDGQAFSDPVKAQAMLDSVPLGETAIYTVRRGESAGGRIFDATVTILRQFNVFYLSVFLLGLGFLIVGYVVVMTRPQGEIQRRFGRYGLIVMLFFGLTSLRGGPDGHLSWYLWPLRIASLGSVLLAPATFIGFFFHFPVRKKAADKRWPIVSLYAAGFLLTAALVPREWYRGPEIINRIAGFATVGSFTAGLTMFVVSYWRDVERARREQLRPILVGVALGLAAFTYLIAWVLIDPFFFLYPARMTPVLLVASIPLAFGYSIFRYRLMDIDLIIKRSLIYGSVTATVAAMYLVIVYGVGSVAAQFMGTEQNRALNIFAFVLIALAFEPIKRRTQSWVDRSFYQERLNYQRALLEFSRELPRQMNLEQILGSMISRISDTMHVEKVAVVLCDGGEGCFHVTKGIDPGCCRFVPGAHGLIETLREKKVPQSFHFLGEESEALAIDETDREMIIRSGIVLAVPLFLKDRLIGTMNVGPKQSGKVYSQEDIDLLATVAGQAAIAIENARLHRSEIEKQKIEEELSLARRIQQGLLPKADPELAGLDISGISLPALSVGGDYFDYIPMGPGRLLVVVADVSGKGMAAALYMSKIQGMIQLAASMYQSPREMLVHVNRLLYDGIERNSFITMILALFDVRRGTVRICRAGHNKAVIGLGTSLEYLQSTGIGLGLERGPVFERTLQEIERPLSPESLFIFYSDGLTEAMNRAEEQFGEENLCAIVSASRNGSARDMQAAIVLAAERFRGPAEQHDDITVVVVKARP